MNTKISCTLREKRENGRMNGTIQKRRKMKDRVIFQKPRIIPDALKQALPFATKHADDDVEISEALEKLAVEHETSVANSYVPVSQSSVFRLYRGSKGYGIIRDTAFDDDGVRRVMRTFFIFKRKYAIRDSETKKPVAMGNALKYLIVDCNAIARQTGKQFEIVDLDKKIVHRSRVSLPVFDASDVSELVGCDK